MKIPILSKWIESQVEKRLQKRYVYMQSFCKTVRDIILDDDILLDAMAKQRILLLKQKRKPIAIFISEKIFENIISKVSLPSCAQKKISEGETSITYIAKIPVYVNSLLKDAPLLVVGSITWKSEVNNDSHE